MSEFEVDIEIGIRIEIVFRYLTNLNDTPRWYSAVKSARLVEGTGPGLGSKYEILRQLPQGRAEDIVEVTEFEPPHLFTFRTSKGATPFRYKYVLEEKNGATVVRLHGEISLSGGARLLSPLATQAFKRGMQSNLETLKRLLESSQPER